MRDDPNEVVARGLKDAREKWMAEDPSTMTTTEPQFCGFDGEGKPWNDFAEPFEQVRQAAVYVVDVETGYFHGWFERRSSASALTIGRR